MAIVALPPGELYQGKWRIADPSKIVPVARTEFLQGLCGEFDHETPLEDINLTYKRDVKAALVRQLQGWYKQIKAINGRLPKFSKWCSSLLPNDKELQQYISKLGQEAVRRKIVISAEPLDILRAGASPHFMSCLNWADREGVGALENFDYVLPEIVEKYPGFIVAYTDDENGMMMSRGFLMHARDIKTGEDVVVLQGPMHHALTGEMLAGFLAGKTKVCRPYYPYGYGNKPDAPMEVSFVECFKDAIHFDVMTNVEKKMVVPIKT